MTQFGDFCQVQLLFGDYGYVKGYQAKLSPNFVIECNFIVQLDKEFDVSKVLALNAIIVSTLSHT